MPILNNIPRKNAPKIMGHLWNREATSNRGQHIPNGFEGLSYNSQFTETDIPPLGTHFNVATITQLRPTRQQVPGVPVSLKKFERISPANTSESFAVGKPVPVVARVGGPSPHSDTPFHPKPHINLPPVTKPVQVSGEKIPAVQGSFFDTTETPKTLTAHTNNDPNTRRWQTIKTGAANV